MNNIDELGYFSKTVADRLGVSADTLRAWALKLEEKGVPFERNENKQRIYYEKEIRMFENMKELLDLQQPMNKVVPIIAEKMKKGEYDKPTENNAVITPRVIRENNALATPDQRLDQQLQQLVDVFQQMKLEQTETMQRIEGNAKKTDEKLDSVLEELKKEQEEKKMLNEKLQIAVDLLQQAEARESQQEEKKGLFKRLFGG